MKRLFGILLVLGGIALGYMGYTQLEDNTAKLKIGDLEVSASDKDSKQEAYLYFGLGAVCLIAGLMVSRGKG